MDRSNLKQFLSDLVEFDTSISPSQNLLPDSDCADYLHQHAESFGWQVLSPEVNFRGDDSKPLYPVLLAKRGKTEGKTVLFLGHIDVVPVTEEEMNEWNYEPFNPTVDDDRLLGRGSGDMKGGVAAFFGAFDTKEIEQGNVVIALSGDEEIGGMDTVPAMIAVLENEDLIPDYVINAEGSGTPVIVTKRRGGTQVRYSFDLDYDRVHGRSSTKKFYSSLGDGSEGLHSMSFLQGASSHAMITAGVHMMDKPISHVQSSSNKINSVPREVVVAYVEQDPSWSEEIMYSKGLTKIMHALASVSSLHYPIVKSKFGPSICPNLINIDSEAQKGSITFDIRSMLKDSESHKVVAQLIQDHFRAYGIETKYEIGLAIDPVNVDPETELAVLTQEIAEQHDFRIMARGEKLGGASDTRFFTTMGIPGIELGPISHNAHGINESVELDGILKLVKIYRDLYDRLQ